MLDVYRDKYVGEKTEDGTTTYGTESNVYAGNHSYTATEGGIGATAELTTEQRSWKEDGYINLVNSYRIPDSGDIGRTGWRYRTLIHIPTGIRVSGYISGNAELLVTEGCEHENCIVCKYLEKLPVSIVLSRYHIALTGGYYGLLYVQIPVD